MSRRHKVWALVIAILLLGCSATALFALLNRSSGPPSPQQWLQEVRSNPKRETIVGSIDVTSILLEPDESYVPKLIAELGWQEGGWRFHLYDEGRRALLGALAACGGEDAAEALAGIYADMEVESHVEPMGPFSLPQSGESFDLYQKQFGDWRWPSVVLDQCTYTAFVSPGPKSGMDVFIGMDLDSDSLYESVYPTGLSDYTMHRWHMGQRDLPPKTPLKLELNDGTLVITYNEEITPTESNDWDWGNRVGTSTIAFSNLTMDTDMDGLTDIGEKCLHTSPYRKDTDSDGMEDAVDPSPQIDASAMGYLERGIARAMSFYHLSWMELKSTPERDSHAVEYPYQATRLYLAPSQDVAWTTGPSVYGIVERISPNDDSLSTNPSVLSKKEILQFDPSDQESSKHAIAAIFCREAFGYVSEDRISYVVYYDFGYGGDLVVLSDVEGELYPSARINAWMS